MRLGLTQTEILEKAGSRTQRTVDFRILPWYNTESRAAAGRIGPFDSMPPQAPP